MHYPGTYVHGGYNRETTILAGLPVLNEDLVNMPNWLVLVLRIEGGDVIRLGGVEVLGCRHELNIRYVTLIRQFRFRDGSSRETTLTSRRFVSMADVHHAGIEWTLVPEKVDARSGELAGPGSAGVVHGRGLASCRSWWRLVVGRARSSSAAIAGYAAVRPRPQVRR